MTRSPFAALCGAVCAGLLATAVASCEAPTTAPAVTVPSIGSQFPTTAGGASPPGLTPAVVAYTFPVRVTGTQAPACVARVNGMLPDPACTPGSVGSTDTGQVCATGFSDRHRPADVRTARRAAMKAYRTPDATLRIVEYDHLIPLSLGGSNDVTNLWPQVSDLPGQGIRNSKDDVEFKLWRAVCVAHTVHLTDVQAQMARDWTAAEKFFDLR